MPWASITAMRSLCTSMRRLLNSPQHRSGRNTPESASVSAIAKCSSSPIFPCIPTSRPARALLETLEQPPAPGRGRPESLPDRDLPRYTAGAIDYALDQGARKQEILGEDAMFGPAPISATLRTALRTALAGAATAALTVAGSTVTASAQT